MANVFDTFEESNFAQTEQIVKWTLFGSVISLVAVMIVFFNR